MEQAGTLGIIFPQTLHAKCAPFFYWLSKSLSPSDLELKPSGETLFPLTSSVCFVSARGCSRVAILEEKQSVLRLPLKVQLPHSLFWKLRSVGRLNFFRGLICSHTILALSHLPFLDPPNTGKCPWMKLQIEKTIATKPVFLCVSICVCVHLLWKVLDIPPLLLAF